MNLLMGHLVGDYLLQNDWMALNKKRSSWHCGVHCLLYTLAIALFTGWHVLPLAVVATTHFAIDRTGVVLGWMKLIGQSRFSEPPMGPWSIVVVDNTMHLLVLYITSLVIA